MSYVHLTISERVKIETLADLNYSIREIARKLGRSPSTISREMKRYESEGPYQAELAQEAYAGKKKCCGAKSKGTEVTVAIVQQKLDETWSPEQIANRLFEGRLCFKTIYRWIYKGVIQVPLTMLRQKGKRRKPQETRGRFTIGTPIAKRPKEVQKRETFGHWELDTVVSSRGKSKACTENPLVHRHQNAGPYLSFYGKSGSYVVPTLSEGRLSHGDHRPGQRIQLLQLT